MVSLLIDQDPKSVKVPLSAKLGFGAALRMLHRAYMRQLQAVLSPHEISVAQYLHLRALHEEGALAQNEISNRLGIEKASSTLVLDSLDRAGLILRIRDGTDRRRVRVSLTPKGQALTRRLMSVAKQVAISAGTGLSDEDQHRFFTVVDRMLINLSGGRKTPPEY